MYWDEWKTLDRNTVMLASQTECVCVFSVVCVQAVTLAYRQIGLFSSLTSEITLQSLEELRKRDLLNISPLGHFP